MVRFAILACAMIFTVAALPVYANVPDTSPNILVFLVDDMGWGDLGCYGHPFMITPNLDCLAEQGMRFTDCHSGSSICSPSRAAILTGRAPFRLGIWQLCGGTVHLRDQEVTIAEILKEKGYQTSFVGKWHLGSLNGKHPTPGDQGFDKWMVRAGGKFVTHAEPVPYTDGGSCDDVVQQSINLLKERNPDKPFFLEVCIREPHTPLNPPQRYMELYDNERVRRLEKFIRYGRVLRPSYVDGHPELARYYYGTVTQLDEAFGRLMATLDSLDLRENTLVFFTSDNGPEHPVSADKSRDRSWGTPGVFRGMKRYLYEGGTRVPGIMRWPESIKAGVVCDQLISSVDLLPTVCDIVDAPLPTDRPIDGVSILPVLEGDPFLREKPLVWNISYTHAPQMKLRLGDYALLGYFDPIGEDEPMQTWIKEATLTNLELYHVGKDPRQEVDLRYDEFELMVLLKEKMATILKDIQDESPLWPNSRGGTRPINEGMEIGMPGAVTK